jgi:hypothetical protein
MFAKWIQSLFSKPGSPVASAAVAKPTWPTRRARLQSMANPTEEHRAQWRELVESLLAGDAGDRREFPGSLMLAKLRLRSLPSNFVVRGDLDLRQCQRLKRIGHGLIVEGNLQIGGRCDDPLWYEKTGPFPLGKDAQPPLTALPEGLRVGGQLTLRACHGLTRLPEDFAVKSLHIEGCHELESLHVAHLENLQNLTIKGCPRLSRLPESLHVRGDLRLIGLRLEELPPDLRVDGSLILECCPRLTRLPASLKIGKNLIVRNCPLSELAVNLVIGGHLVIKRCPNLAALPADLNVAGDVRISECRGLTTLGSISRFWNSLFVQRCVNLKSLPVGLIVPGRLDLTGCTGLTSLSADTEIGFQLQNTWHPTLVLVDCHALQSLPDDLSILGAIDLAGSGLKDLPPELSDVRVVWRGIAISAVAALHPEQLSAIEILQEPNAEVRRIMLERVGCDHVLEKANARLIDSDHDAGGPRKLVQVSESRYLRCRCPSTGRVYLLRVPPTTGSCRAAAAWLAGFDNPNDYRPLLET